MHPRRRSFRSTFAALVVGLLVLGGCGGGTDGGTPAADPEPANEEVAGTEPEAEGGDDATEAAAEFDVSVVEFVVPYEPGGGYDQYVRVIAPFLSDCLGGTDVIAINEPGAGSLLATNQTGIASADGSRIQIFNTIGAIGAQMAEAEGANFDLAEFTWLSRITDEPSAISVAADSEFEDFEDLIDADRPVRFVATGPGSNEYIFASVLAEVYDFDVEIVTGFAGSGEAQASVIQGDADAQVLSIGSSLGPIEAGDLRAVALVGSETHQQLPDTPTVYDYPPTQGQEETLDGLVGLVEVARAVAGPPGMEEETTRALRDGFECALNNEEFLAQAEDQERDIGYLSGEEMQALIADVLDAPPAFRDLVAESF